MNEQPHREFMQRYEPIHEPFVRFCSSQAYGLMSAEDLVQEAVLAALQGFERLKDKEKLLGFMIGIVRNIVRNRWRRAKFRGVLEEEALERLESQAPSPEVALDIHYLLKALQELPAKQKEAILLFEISGFSIREVSEIQDSSVSATKTRLSRARQRLRELLSEESGSLSVTQRLAIYSSILL